MVSEKNFRPAILPYLLGFFVVALIGLATTSHAEDKAKAEKTEKPEAEANPTVSEDPALEPGAEYVCESEISYMWKKIVVTKRQDSKTKKVESVQEAGPTEEEFFATVGETGQLKTEVAHRLEVKLPSIQDEAMDHCRSLHQNLTGCIGSGIDSSSNEYSTLDFELRKRLLASIKERCDDSFGLCIDTQAKPVKCHISRPPEVKKANATSSKKEEEKGKAPTKEKKGGKKK